MSWPETQDFWSDYARAHRPVVTMSASPVHGDGPEEVTTLCLRCHQRRTFILRWEDFILHGVPRQWGCPKIPLRYRLERWWNKEGIPTWDHREVPPWIEKEKAKRK